MKPQVEIYDTTLRDGSQGEGINFSVADKLRIAEKLDAFGVHYIEGGWPGSNPKDIEFFAEARTAKFKNARTRRVRLHARKRRAGRTGRPGAPAHRGGDARRDDFRQDFDAARQGSPALHAGGKSGDDRRHREISQGPRQVCHLRRRTLLRRLQARSRIRRRHLAGGGKGGRGMRRALRHERRLSAGRSCRKSRKSPSAN